MLERTIRAITAGKAIVGAEKPIPSRGLHLKGAAFESATY